MEMLHFDSWSFLRKRKSHSDYLFQEAIRKNTEVSYTVVGPEQKSLKLNQPFVLPGTNCPLCVDDSFYI